MHFNLPKPLHGWREFVGEVAIIVLGVLIALTAEQLVEAWHWRSRTAEARELLRNEVGHQFVVMEERAAVTQCVDEQLTKIENAVLSAGAVLTPLPLYREKNIIYTFRVPSRAWTDSAWQSVITEGLSAHLTARERELLPIHYSQFALAKARNEAEDGIMGELTSLSKPLPLDPQVKAAFIKTIEVERSHNESLGILASQMMIRIRELNYVPPAAEARAWLDKSGTLKFCRDHGYTVPPVPSA